VQVELAPDVGELVGSRLDEADPGEPAGLASLGPQALDPARPIDAAAVAVYRTVDDHGAILT
jgi:hypothetical protein